jgi:hypothetical protein
MRPDGAAMVCHFFNETKVTYIGSVKQIQGNKKSLPAKEGF